jgi:hypothetical protein
LSTNLVVVENTVLNIVWIRNQNRSPNWNRNRNFSKVVTGTAINHYGSTTLLLETKYEAVQESLRKKFLKCLKLVQRRKVQGDQRIHMKLILPTQNFGSEYAAETNVVFFQLERRKAIY